MSIQSASPAKSPKTDPGSGKVLVWDVPVRVFHWLLVLCFAGAYLTAESERWRVVHVTLGYTMAGLIGFRLIWGLAGTRYARFSSFVRGPKAVAQYLRDLLRGRPDHHIGHNPAGAWAIVALLGLAFAVALTGWTVYNDIGGDRMSEVHEAAASVMLAIVGVHVVGVLVSSWLHRENLIGAMVSGSKPGRPRDGIPKSWRSIAALIIVATLGYWAFAWQATPPASTTVDLHASIDKTGDKDDNDD
jgi:cytochrome b